MPMGRHAVRRRRRRPPVPWLAMAVLGLAAGATVTGVLLWGGARPGTAVTVGVIAAVGAAVAQAMAARLPEQEPGPDGADGDPGPDAVP